MQTGAPILGTRTIQGHPTGTPIENEDNLVFSAGRGVRPFTEVFGFDDSPKACEQMLSGQARFRAVLDFAH